VNSLIMYRCHSHCSFVHKGPASPPLQPSCRADFNQASSRTIFFDLFLFLPFTFPLHLSSDFLPSPCRTRPIHTNIRLRPNNPLNTMPLTGQAVPSVPVQTPMKTGLKSRISQRGEEYRIVLPSVTTVSITDLATPLPY
jgi:hypothetical protein